MKTIFEKLGGTYRQMLYGLIHFRNRLIQQGRYTDVADELLIKLQKARRCRHG